MPVAKLRTIGIRKVYPGTVALNEVSIAFDMGKVHALLGKNGAGKTTLIKILAGAIQPTAGSLEIDGKTVRLGSPQDAFRNGIATVYQELSLLPELTVAENILFGRLPHRSGSFGLGRFAIDWRRVYEGAAVVLAELGVELDVRKNVKHLGVAQQQLVEIARAMSYGPSVLMLDEPTSALSHHETAALFRLIRTLAGRGVVVIYISHRLQELSAIVDRLSVLRDGDLIGTLSMQDATPRRIASMMFGRALPEGCPPDVTAGTATVMDVRCLARRGRFENVSFSLKCGEILGLAGMMGAGRTSLLTSIFGAAPIDAGEIEIGGRTVRRPTIGTMKRAGVGLAPENRKEQALVQILGTGDNICLAGLNRIALGGLIWPGRQRPVVQRTIRKLEIDVHDPAAPVSLLSGGNQQKVVVGNWLNTQPRIMLLDEPTRGVDAEARQQIFQLIWQLARQGISSIFVSSELEELIQVCHRILVMRSGRLVAEVHPAGLPISRLLALCIEN